MSKSFFLVDSPLQYLNAVEARRAFEITSQEAVLIVFGGVSEKNLEQIKSLIDQNLWGELHYFRHNQHRWLRYLYVWRLSSIARSSKVNHVFIGEYRSDLMRHFIDRSHTANAFLLDDGNVSKIIHQGILQGDHLPKPNILRKTLNFIVGLKDREFFDINFFTVYDLPESLSPGNRKVVRNDYLEIKEKIQGRKEKMSQVYFLGNNLPELALVSEEDYLYYLTRIVEYYTGKGLELFYLPHRRESEDKLSRIESMDGITIKRLDKPTEQYLIAADKIPTHLGSFFSSALDNCYNIFGDTIQITAFRIPEEKITSEIHEKVRLIYEQYKCYKSSFNIVDLDETSNFAK